MRDEAETSKRCVQSRSNLDPQQLSSTSLKNLRPDARALIIILKAEALFIGGHQVVFEGCFENTNKGQRMNYLSNEIGHRLWLQGPLNYLSGERRTNYITAIFRKILEFLYV
jgi:hypothetical protein